MADKLKAQFKCVLHGSFRKHFREIKRIHKLFAEAGIEVLAPDVSRITGEKDKFVLLENDKSDDPRVIELLYLHHLKRLGQNGFSYFVNPAGYIGRSASYELGIAQASNTRCFFLEVPADHPAFIHRSSIWSPDDLVSYIVDNGQLPEPKIKRNEAVIHKLWQNLIVPGSVVAVGGIIEYVPSGQKKEKEVLLVKTHKWGGRYCIVGGKVRRNERLEETLAREVKEETGLAGCIGDHVCTFDQIKNSGYYNSSVNHIFVDKVVRVASKRVVLNDEAEEYIWLPPRIALRELDIEPNARYTIQLYSDLTNRHAV